MSGSADIQNDLIVRGTLTAKQIDLTVVSSSVLYQSGSTKFGDTSDDTHQITGSVNITGSISLNGSAIGTGKLDETTFNSYTSSNNSTNSGQTTRLGYLETASGSLNSFTSSINTTIKSKLDSDNVISSSAQLTGAYDARYILSGSITQTTWDNIANKPGGIVSGSAQINITGTTGFSTFSSSISSSINDVYTFISTDDDTQNGRIGSLETESGSIRGAFNTFTSSASGRLTSLESASASIRSNFNSYTSSNNGRVNAIETSTSSLNSFTSSATGRLNSLESTSSSLNSFASSSTNRLNAIEISTSSFNSFTNSIDLTIKTKLDSDGVISGSLQVDISGTTNYSTFSSSISASVNTLSGSIAVTTSGLSSSIGSLSSSLTTRINNLSSSVATTTSNLSSSIGSLSSSIATSTSGISSSIGSLSSSIATTDNTQNGRLDAIETSTGSLNTFSSSTAGRLTSIETSTSSLNSFTSSINTTIKSKLDNDGVISGSIQVNITGTTGYSTFSSSVSTSFGSLSASVASINNTQNNRLDSIETSTSSLNSYTSSNTTIINAIHTSTSSLNSFSSSILGAIEVTGSNVTIKGDLLVKGTTTKIDSTTVNIGDNIIELNGTGTSNGGLVVRDGVGANIISGSLLWDTTLDYWKAGPLGSEERIILVNEYNTFSTSINSRANSIESTTSSLNSFTSSINTTIKSKLDSEGVVSGSSQIVITGTTGYSTFSSSISSSIGSLSSSVATTTSGLSSSINSLSSSVSTSIGSLSSSVAINASGLSSSIGSLSSSVATTTSGLSSSIGSLSSSVSTTDANQNTRLGYLETSSGSLNSFTSSIATTIKSKLDSESVISGSIQIDITATTNYSSFSSSIATTTSNLSSSIGGLSSSVATINNTQNGRLDNLETASGSLNSFTSSTSGRLNSIETSTSSLNTFTSSADGRLGSLETASGSIRTDFNSFTSSAIGRLNSIEGITGSYATTGSNTFKGTQIISGSIYVETGSVLYTSEINTAPGTMFNGLNINSNGGRISLGANSYGVRVTDDFSVQSNSLYQFRVKDNGSGIWDTHVYNSLHVTDKLDVTGSSNFGQYSFSDTHKFTGSVYITGSEVINGNLTVTGSFKLHDTASNFNIIGNIFGQTSILSPDGALILGPGYGGVQINCVFPDLTVNGNIVGSTISGSFTGSGAGLYNIPASGITGLELNKIASGSVSASIQSDGTFRVNGDTYIDGTITAKEIHTSFVTSSVLYESGSTKFGDTLDDNHNFTGSVKITGSLYVNGSVVGTGKLDETTFNSYTSSITPRVASLETASGSAVTRLNAIETSTSSLNSFSSSAIVRLNSLESKTGSYATNGSNTFIGDEVISGSLSVSGSLNLTNANLTGIKYLHTQASLATTWNINHGLGYDYPNVTVYDNNKRVMIPDEIISVDSNNIQLVFSISEYGHALITVGGLTNATADNVLFSQTGSYYNTQQNIGITGSLVVTGDVDATNFNTTSDKKLKTNLEKIENALDKIEKINGYTFDWLESYSEDRSRQIGMIADEVYEVQPELIAKRSILIEGIEEEIKLLDYSKVTALLIEAVKELSDRVTKLESKKKKSK